MCILRIGVVLSVQWQVNVESFDPGNTIDLDLLNGTWRLQYTSASDVLILFQSAATLPFFEVCKPTMFMFDWWTWYLSCILFVI